MNKNIKNPIAVVVVEFAKSVLFDVNKTLQLHFYSVFLEVDKWTLPK